MKHYILALVLFCSGCTNTTPQSKAPHQKAAAQEKQQETSIKQQKELSPLEKDVKKYSQYSGYKSYALAHEVNRRWVSGFSYNYSSQQEADERALLECNHRRKTDGIHSPCSILARGDETPDLPNLYGDYQGCGDPAYIAHINDRLFFYEKLDRESYEKALADLQSTPFDKRSGVEKQLYLRRNTVLSARFDTKEVAQENIRKIEEKAFSVFKLFVEDGDAHHQASIAKGWLALGQGDEKTAVKYLLESTNTKGSAVLGSFGPDMSLARELYKRGYSDAVLSYLRGSEAFWQTDKANEFRKTWRKMIANECPIQFQFYDTTNINKLGL